MEKNVEQQLAIVQEYIYSVTHIRLDVCGGSWIYHYNIRRIAT